MFTTGFKLWFGVFVAAFGAASFAGYTGSKDSFANKSAVHSRFLTTCVRSPSTMISHARGREL